MDHNFLEYRPMRSFGFVVLVLSSSAFHTVVFAGSFMVFEPTNDAPGVGPLVSYPPQIRMSADGNTISGESYTFDGLRYTAADGWIWSATDGLRSLSHLPGVPLYHSKLGYRIVSGISNDGDVLVGNPYSNIQEIHGGFRWSEADGFRAIEMDKVYGVSGDGSTVVGKKLVGPKKFEAFYWRQETGLVSLGPTEVGGIPPADYNRITASFDGSVVVGAAGFDGVTSEAFRYTTATGMVGLGYLNGGEAGSAATDVSDDGAAVAGYSGTHGFFWTAESGMTDLGPIIDNFPHVALSGNGQIAASEAIRGADGATAFLWDPTRGRQWLDEVASAANIDLHGYRLSGPQDISYDGRVIVGAATAPDGRTLSFRLDLRPVPEPTAAALALTAVAFFRRKPRPVVAVGA